jgi:hypothetical protein
MARDALELFYSYARADERLRDQIHKYLRPLRREGLLRADEDISLSSAQIILLLVSPDFVSSNHCMKIEMPAALRMHMTGRACAIPVILRPCDWEITSLSKIQVLPKNGKPVTRWLNRDAAFTDIAKGIRRVVEEMR